MDKIIDIINTLRKAGLCMIPSGGGKEGKSPDLSSWKQFQKTLPPDDLYLSWFHNKKPSLWIVVTGKISGIVVVDIDSQEAMAVMGDLKAHVRTPRGGAHYYFKHPGYHVKSKVGILPHIDIRADGGLANVIGTNPKTGGEYRIEIMPMPENIYPLEKMPKEILEKLDGSKPASEATPKTGPEEPIREGKRNSTLASMAGALQRQGIPFKVIETALLETNRLRCEPPLPDDEVRRIVNSISRYEPAGTTPRPQPMEPEITSARALSEKYFSDLQFAIPGIIPEGLTILAGKPKSGKSWLGIQFGYSVAIGKNLLIGKNPLGDPKCEKGRALVLGLEDGQRRLQYRISTFDESKIRDWHKTKSGSVHLSMFLDEIPEGLDIATQWPKIGNGGIERLEKYLDEHPDTRLIVVDIIKRLTPKKGRGAAYDEDYDSVQPLQELATRRRVAILGIHHTRKALAEDPFEMVSGTFGLTGSADNILVLRRESGDEYTLSITGRDIVSRNLALTFVDSRWIYLGDADIYFMGQERTDILELIKDGNSMSPSEIAKSLCKNISTTKTLLYRMLHDGVVTKDSKGKYSTRRSK